MARRRVLMMTRNDLVPPDSLEGMSEKDIDPIKTDYDVSVQLEHSGHEVRIVGLEGDLKPLIEAIADFKPHIVFNLLEEFAHSQEQMAHVLGYLELIGQPYTGCNPIGMLFSTDKARQRKILRHHRVRVPEYMIARRGVRWGAGERGGVHPQRLRFPLIVKSLTAHGSVGISQASIVEDDAHLAERIAFVHEQVGTDAIVEEFIDGRELYVALIGNQRLQAFPIWELHFDNLPEGSRRIATHKAKWDLKYQESRGIITREAKDLPEALAQRIVHTCKRAYRALEQTGYARMDLRLTEGETPRLYFIESNPNPQLASDEDFALAAHAANVTYQNLIERIVNLGIRYQRTRQ